MLIHVVTTEPAEEPDSRWAGLAYGYVPGSGGPVMSFNVDSSQLATIRSLEAGGSTPRIVEIPFSQTTRVVPVPTTSYDDVLAAIDYMRTNPAP